MIFGVVSLGSVIFLLFIILIKVGLTIFSRDIYPYTRNGLRPPLYDGFKLPVQEKEEPIETHAQHVQRFKDERNQDILIQHNQFLRTELGKLYLLLLKEA